MVRITQNEAVRFVQHALRSAVPGVTFEVQAFTRVDGRPGLRAKANTPDYEERFYIFQENGRADWDATALVDQAVQQFTVGVAPRDSESGK